MININISGGDPRRSFFERNSFQISLAGIYVSFLYLKVFCSCSDQNSKSFIFPALKIQWSTDLDGIVVSVILKGGVL